MSLFHTSTTPAHVRGSATSREAAESIQPDVGRIQALVLGCIRRHPDGLTCDQAEVITGLSHQTCSARFRELSSCQPPFIQKVPTEDGKFLRRPTRSGRGAYVYKAAA